MEAFNVIRKQARERRDKAINTARDEYAATLTRISALEQDLLGRDVSTHKSIASCIERVIPPDREFTTVDVMTALEALDERRSWRKRSVDSHISRLRERGLVRRLSKAKGVEPAIYVRSGAAVEPFPFDDATMLEVAREVLGDKRMTLTELTVAMLEAGYRTTMEPKALRAALGVAMRKQPGAFRCEGGRWLAS